MSAPAETLRTHLDYTAWATRRLLDAAVALTPEEWTRDFGTADRSVLGTLTHVFGADRIWLARIRGGPPEHFRRPEGYEADRLAAEWRGVLAEWRDWAAPLTDEAVLARCRYTDMKGRPWVSPLWQIVLHVVTHGTHPRGQVAGFLRSLGKVPPNLDLIAYYREKDPGQVG